MIPKEKINYLNFKPKIPPVQELEMNFKSITVLDLVVKIKFFISAIHPRSYSLSELMRPDG